MVASCEAEPDELGTQFFQTGTAQGTEVGFDVIAYNVNNNNVLEADNDKLTEATLGAFDEPNFGMQKSSYVTQVRLSAYDPDFGVNPVVDSVVLQMKPLYYTVADSVQKPTEVDVTYTGEIPAKKVVTSYPIKKYGKAKRNLTIKVHEVTDFLNSIETNYNSDYQVSTGTELGTKTFDGFVRSVKITKKSDNAELLSRDAALRIPLMASFFQNKIIDKKGSFELKDAASFIRYFKGLRISVDEVDGYIFNFNPNEITTIIYYKHDKSATDNSKVDATYTLDLGSSNVHFNQIGYNRPSAYTTAINNINTNTGDATLYLQGMGGPGAEIVIPQPIIDKLKALYKNDKAGILSAKVRLYTDSDLWKSSYAKPSTFTVLTKDASKSPAEFSFLKDLIAFQYSGAYKMVNTVDIDKNPAYYEIGITQTIKNIVEKEESNKPIAINVGSFQTSSTTGAFLGVDFTNRAYTPNRIVIVGTDPNLDSNPNPADSKYAQLKVIYSKK